MINYLKGSNVLKKVYQKVPKEYWEEFLKDQTKFIKTRVALFCALSVVIYFAAVLAGFMITPEKTSNIELIVGAVLAIGAALIFYFNTKVRTVISAKLNAYFFTIFLLALLVKLGIFYVDAPSDSSSLFVFIIFFVVLTLPWTTLDVVIVGLLNIGAYAGQYLYIRGLPYITKSYFTLEEFLEGLVFILMAFVLCIIIRRNETRREIENFVLFKEVENKNQQMEKELEWATRIHKTIISHSANTDKVDIAINYLPIHYIGGDYVKFEFIDENRLIFIVSDVTGHGVPAALLVNRMHTEFERLAKEGKEPGVLLKELNEFIKEDFGESDMYLSAFCGLLDFKKSRLLYSNYGHPPQYLYHAKEGKIESFTSLTSLLGLPTPDNKVYQKEADFAEGDTFVLYTDGIIETVDAAGEEYGNERLEKFLMDNYNLPGKDFNDKLLSNLDDFKTGSFNDDICLLTMNIKEHQNIFTLGSHIFKHGEEKG